MKNPARRFVLLTLGLAGLVCGGIGLFNFFVDPYNRFGNNRLGVYISAERETKPTEVRRQPHNALLLGNSRMGMIQPKQLTGFRFFNAAFGGGTPEEAYYFIRRFATHQDLVILGIDLGQGDPKVEQGDTFAPPTLRDALDNVLNVKTVECSVRTIASHLAGKPASIASDGSFDTSGWFKIYDQENTNHLAWQLAGMKSVCDNYTNAARLTFYAKIAECLRERNIPCVVFIPPMHKAVADHLVSSPNVGVYQAWRRELDLIFTNVVDLSVSAYSAPENFFKSDPVHFKPDLGARMLNEEVVPMAEKLAQSKHLKPAAPQ